ncbi:MAG: tetratricopeptide repeat protein [Propionivibrio sp.]|uniref:YfgM family protein n=1 Tax=Propionivibrio sp. TaxID=2212460 RepID=UPI001A58C509|nr:tetratricopeptide repeat protein [Propionivibrio sp.]MBL8413470.1 tetratricopeptide repeat protein [Propionivibrio sp.]
MATYDLEEQEQLDEIKTWWKQHGNLLINVITALSLIVVAWQGWNWYQRNQSAQASMVYNLLQKSVLEKDSQRVRTASDQLLDKFSGTSYASLGALAAAKVMIDAGDAKSAKTQLLWVVEHGKDELRDLARLRLAAVLLDEKEYDQALKQLDGSVGAGFEAIFSDNRGDVFSAQGKKAEALGAYQNAMGKLDAKDKSLKGRNSAPQEQTNAVYRELLRQKIDALGVNPQ